MKYAEGQSSLNTEGDAEQSLTNQLLRQHQISKFLGVSLKLHSFPHAVLFSLLQI